MKRNYVGVAALLASAGMCGSAAHAQAVAEAPAEDSGGLAEIVVTAEKRVESAQKTPISMSVISAEEISRKGIADFETLSANDTSVNFASNGGEGYLTVRGISSHDTTEIGDPAVPVVIDGFTTIRSYTLTTSLYDLQRIEVLRGPQGTLYGRNAEGGLVNVITQRPTGDFGAGGSVELGNFNTNNFTAWLNLPVNDILKLRVSAASRRHDGYRDILASAGSGSYKADDEDSRSARIQLLFTPFDKFEVWLEFQSTTIGGVGQANDYILFNPGITPPATADNPNPVPDISHDKPLLGDPRRFPMYGQVSEDIDDKVYKWQFSYGGLPWGTSITYLGGYDNLQFHHDSTLPTLFGLPLDTPVLSYQNEYPKTTNHELRLTSDTSRPFIWQAGLYYFEERSTNLDTYIQTNPNTAQAATQVDFLFPLVDTKSHAAFGQASYSITPEHKITAGVRYSDDTKSRNGTFDLQAFGLFNQSQLGHSESSKTTFHAGYDWTPTDRNMVYAKFDTGYKPGGFTTCNPYQPETVKAGEVGTKNRFLGNTLQVNLAGFYNKYENQQVSALSATCASGTVVENAGSSTIYGMEASVNMLATEADKVDLSLTLLHARFDSFLAYPTNGAATYFANCPNKEDGNCQLGGNMLPQAPNVTAAIGYEHDWKLPNGATVNARGEGRYQTRSYFDSFNFGDSEQPGYGLLNAYIGYKAEKWGVNLYGRNLADKVYLVDASEITSLSAHVYRYGFGAPRTFGVHFDASF